MKTELDEKLCKKYPEIFRDRHGDMRTTCMCWGIDVGDGWYNIIDCLCANIQNHFKNEQSNRKWAVQHNAMVTAAKAGDWTLFDERYGKFNPEYQEREKQSLLTAELREVPPEAQQVVAVQVKEKFGGLRFYTNGASDFVDGAICLAESLSHRTCEECGAPGRTRGPGWYVTLCAEHAKAHDKHTDEQLDKINYQRSLEFTEDELKGVKLDKSGLVPDNVVQRILEKRKAKE